MCQDTSRNLMFTHLPQAADCALALCVAPKKLSAAQKSGHICNMLYQLLFDGGL